MGNKLRMSELNKLCETSEHRMILGWLKSTDYNNRLTRQELKDLLHVTDRGVRRYIEEMRKLGIPVASDTEHPGYYLPKTWKQFEVFSKAYTHRAYMVIKTHSQMVKAAEVLYGGQIEMGDVEK